MNRVAELRRPSRVACSDLLGHWLFGMSSQSGKKLFSLSFYTLINYLMAFKTSLATILCILVTYCSEASPVPPSNIFSNLDNFRLESWNGSILRSENVPLFKIATIHQTSLLPLGIKLIFQNCYEVSKSAPLLSAIRLNANPIPKNQTEKQDKQLIEDRNVHCDDDALYGLVGFLIVWVMWPNI